MSIQSKVREENHQTSDIILEGSKQLVKRVCDLDGKIPYSGTNNNFPSIRAMPRAYLSEIKYFAHNCAFWVCHWQRGQSGKGRQSLSKPLPARRGGEGCISWRGSSCSFQKRHVQSVMGGRREEKEGNVSRRVRGRKEGKEEKEKKKRGTKQEIGEVRSFTYLCDKCSRQVRREPVAVSARARTGSQPPCSGRSPPSAACPDARLSRFRPSVCLQRPNGEIGVF